MSGEKDAGFETGLSRREFMAATAAAGLGLMLENSAPVQAVGTGGGKADEIRVALIGVGSQGRVLLNDCLKIQKPARIRFVALCDIWEYHRNYAANILKKYNQPVNVYMDYQEMLAKEKNIDAVIVATPDFRHAEHAIACLKAGKHVYCEKEMSNTLEGARALVLAARASKKLLQIGHQRRSNPRYLHALKLITNDKALGRITNFTGQWNRAVQENQGWPKGKEIPEATLKKYGFDSMAQFRNWRWFKKFAGGPIVDLGSHQIDVFSWFLKARPKAVLASGGADYYKGREWYDDVLCIYEYQTAAGPVRGFYQALNTSSFGGYYETFMGDAGTLVISEDVTKGHLFLEQRAQRREWADMSEKVKTMGIEAIELKIGETRGANGQKNSQGQALLAESKKPEHQPHLENFFSAVVSGAPLACPPEVGYETAVSVLKVNEAIAAGKRLEFDPKEFTVG